MKALLILLLMFIMTKGYAMTYEEITSEEKAVLRFTATWCGPCKAYEPIFKRVSDKHPEMKTYTIDVDKFEDISTKFGIRAVPTTMRVEKGKIKLQKSGALPEEETEEFFK